MSADVKDDREVLRCKHCELVQFRTRAETCRRCFEPYKDPEPAPVPVQHIPAPVPMFDWGFALRLLRQARDMSQRDLIRELGGKGNSGAWIANLESNKVQPTLSTFEALTRALDVHPRVLVMMAAAAGQAGVR